MYKSQTVNEFQWSRNSGVVYNPMLLKKKLKIHFEIMLLIVKTDFKELS